MSSVMSPQKNVTRYAAYTSPNSIYGGRDIYGNIYLKSNVPGNAAYTNPTPHSNGSSFAYPTPPTSKNITRKTFLYDERRGPTVTAPPSSQARRRSRSRSRKGKKNRATLSLRVTVLMRVGIRAHAAARARDYQEKEKEKERRADEERVAIERTRRQAEEEGATEEQMRDVLHLAVQTAQDEARLGAFLAGSACVIGGRDKFGVVKVRTRETQKTQGSILGGGLWMMEEVKVDVDDWSQDFCWS
ncbi:hypothetical protein C8F01DRAFT_1355831 [Mycena amicta]|nr:hypothetical protein C8F01DRAFT_1355831 [Mycena amicta]